MCCGFGWLNEVNRCTCATIQLRDTKIARFQTAIQMQQDAVLKPKHRKIISNTCAGIAFIICFCRFRPAIAVHPKA